MSFRGQSIPDEIYFLCMLHNIGATDSGRSLTVEEISTWTAMEPEKIMENLQKLIETDYVHLDIDSGVEKYLTTINGIRKVLSMYS